MARPHPGEGEAAMARVWDVPVRVIHWTMAVLIPVMWWTAEEHLMEWHRRAGMTLLTLLVFRILWGLFGSSTARFSAFVRGPGAVLRYLKSLMGKGEAEAYHGHNPMGGLSVAAMLLMLVAQVGFGLFSVDVDGLESGPLASYVSFDAGREAAGLHETGFNILLALIGLHVAAVLFYLVGRRQNLIRAMISGRGVAARPMQAAPLWRLLLAVVIALLFAGWVWQGAPNPIFKVA